MIAASAMAGCLGTLPLAAQTESDLKNAFEMHYVAPKIDMPASTDGVDINIQKKPPLDTNTWQRDLRRYKTGIPAGQRIIVTLIKVKGKVIEFQMGGGGASRHLHCAPLGPGERETELRYKGPNATPDEKQELTKLQKERQLRDEQRMRECEESADQQRRTMGSRFNIHYPSNPTPDDLTPEVFRKALAEYIDFAPAPPGPKGADGQLPPKPTPPPITQEFEDGTKRLVVMIKDKIDGDNWIGAGIIVSAAQDRLYIVTANHVVRKGPAEASDLQIMVKWLVGEWHPAKLLSSVDTKLDLAVIAVPGLNDLQLPSSLFDSVRVGPPLQHRDSVYFVGFGGGVPWHELAKPDSVSTVDSESVKFQSAFLSQGDSGGPLINERWQIVGLNQSDQQGEGQALPFSRVLEKLREWSYPVNLK